MARVHANVRGRRERPWRGVLTALERCSTGSPKLKQVGQASKARGGRTSRKSWLSALYKDTRAKRVVRAHRRARGKQERLGRGVRAIAELCSRGSPRLVQKDQGSERREGTRSEECDPHRHRPWRMLLTAAHLERHRVPDRAVRACAIGSAVRATTTSCSGRSCPPAATSSCVRRGCTRPPRVESFRVFARMVRAVARMKGTAN